jgi:hypothetical protein
MIDFSVILCLVADIDEMNHECSKYKKEEEGN